MTGQNHIGNFNRIHISRWTVYVHKDFPGRLVVEMLGANEPSDGVRGPFTEIPASRFARVFKCSINFNGQCHKLYLKQYLYRSVWDFVKHLLRPCRAKRALKAAVMLQKNNFDSPDIIAMGRLNYGPVCMKNFLITREIENAHNIYDCLAENWPVETVDALNDKRAFIRELGRTIGRMHAAGIFHGDLRGGNVFAQKTNTSWRFFFLDNERTIKFPGIPNFFRLKNLVQLNMLSADLLGATDRMRFFKVYCQYNRLVSADGKKWIDKVVSKTNKRLQKIVR